MLSSTVKASPCIFTRPMVESSFSITTNIIDLCSGRTEIDTYSAIMTVKYQLKSAGVTASSKFHRKGIFRDPVDINLCYYMQAYRFLYKKRLHSKQEAMLKRQGKLTAKKNLKIKGAKKRSKVHER